VLYSSDKTTQVDQEAGQGDNSTTGSSFCSAHSKLQDDCHTLMSQNHVTHICVTHLGHTPMSLNLHISHIEQVLTVNASQQAIRHATYHRGRCYILITDQRTRHLPATLGDSPHTCHKLMAAVGPRTSRRQTDVCYKSVTAWSWRRPAHHSVPAAAFHL
jgi:hypothetical protein